MKYFKLIEKWFPNQEYCIEFRKYGLEYIVQIRVNDYVLNRTFGIFELKDYQGDAEKLLDNEIEFMLEAIKGKLDGIKADRKLP